VKFCVCQMTAGTTSDKNGRKTKKTGHRRRYKSKTKRKTQNTPPPRAATLKGALAGASTGRVSGGEATDAPASKAASTAAAAANGVGSGTKSPPNPMRQTRSDTNKRQRQPQLTVDDQKRKRQSQEQDEKEKKRQKVMKGRSERSIEALALLALSQEWHIAHSTVPWRKVTISYTREQLRLPPPTDPARPSGSWYNDEIVEAYSHLLRREQAKTRGVMHNNDVITDPRFTYFMMRLHLADPERDAASITRWTTKFMHPWREKIRRANANYIYIPYQANESHWMLLCMSTTHNTITVYDSLKNEVYKEAATVMAKLVQEWWQTPMTIIWGSCAQQPSGNGYDCGPCVCLNMRRLMLTRRRPRALTATRTSREEWGYSNDQAELDDWRWHITKELARERIIEKKD
jgi:hypothetical protein